MLQVPVLKTVDKGALQPAHLALFRELSDLKRIRSAGHAASTATRLFISAWAGLVQGVPPDQVMACSVSAAMAAAKLGGLDRRKLLELGLPPADAYEILRQGFDEVASCIDPQLAAMLRTA